MTRREPGQGGTVVASDRRDRRHAVPRAARASVEFEYPRPSGKRRHLLLIDVSRGGLCFALPFCSLSGVSATHRIDVVIRIGDCDIEGELLVTHVTRESPERILCGGRFRPSNETDRSRLIQAIAELESTEGF